MEDFDLIFLWNSVSIILSNTETWHALSSFCYGKLPEFYAEYGTYATLRISASAQCSSVM
jgi:hypothetical protein